MINKESISKLRQVSRKLIRELGMLQLNSNHSGQTPQNWHALIEIAKTPGMTISELSNLLLLSISSMSRIVSYLDKESYISISYGADKREKRLTITEKGLAEIKVIDEYSNIKIKGAFDFLNDDDQDSIIKSIEKYGNALEKSRKLKEGVKIRKLSTSRTIRKQIIHMIENIQKNEFNIPITDKENISILKAEEAFYFNKSYNFWYAVNEEGEIVGSIGLSKIDERNGELKKLFVAQPYRGKGIAQELMKELVRAAEKHGFTHLYLSTVDVLKGAAKFYEKCGFQKINKNQVPQGFKGSVVDTDFYVGSVNTLGLH